MKLVSPLIAFGFCLVTGNLFAQDMHEAHGHLAADVDTFHAVLAPLWHKPAGAERLREACSQADQLDRAARQIKSGNAESLIAATTAFKAQCGTDQAQSGPAFATVHEAFHQLMRPSRH
jgi:hypothetical protein